MPATGWDVDRLPSARGKVFVVTGGNAGIGYFVSEQLARAGARVLIAGRSAERGHPAERAIRATVPDADLGHLRLVLADLGSVAEAGAGMAALERVDGLVMNAGVLTQFRRQETADGNELVFGTDHLGHAALAAQAAAAGGGQRGEQRLGPSRWRARRPDAAPPARAGAHAEASRRRARRAARRGAGQGRGGMAHRPRGPGSVGTGWAALRAAPPAVAWTPGAGEARAALPGRGDGERMWKVTEQLTGVAWNL